MNNQQLESLKALYGIKEITNNRTGNGIADQNKFKCVSTEVIDASLAQKLQAIKGYHPCGYGFGGFKTQTNKEGEVITTWHCYCSCD